MARIATVTYALTDDVDGTALGDVVEGGENPFTRAFDFGGATYKLDLSDANAEKLATAQAQAAKNIEAAQAEAARIIAEAEKIGAELMAAYTRDEFRVKVEPVKVNGRRGAKKATGRRTVQGSSAAEAAHRKDIRTWAEGLVVGLPDRGRIPAAVSDAFEDNRNVAALAEYARDNGLTMRTAAPAARPVSAPPAQAQEAPAAPPAKAAKAAKAAAK